MVKRAVILAGGLGTRLKPFTETIPKPLLPIGEKAVLEVQIEHLHHYGVREVFVATNYKSDYIERFLGDGSRYGVRVFISKEDKPLGTAGPLRLLKDRLKDPFLVINGDILSLIDYSKLWDFGLKKKALLTVGIKKIVTPYAFGNIFFKRDYVTDIQEKPDFVTYALAGIYMMRPEILELVPQGEYWGIDSLIKTMLKTKRPVAKYEIEEYWLDIGRIDDYNQAQELYKKHFTKPHVLSNTAV